MKTFEEEKENIQDIIKKVGLPRKGIILNIGTGMGWMAVSLAKAGYKVITIEDKPEFQIEAKKLARIHGVEGNIEFKVGSLVRLSFDNESFDGIVSYLTMHHITDIESTIEKMVKFCKKDGKIIIIELTKAGMEAVSRHHINHVYKLVDPSHILKQKNVDFQVLPSELMNVYVCQKKL